MNSEPLINIADYARAARSKLSKDVCDYFEGGALDEITLRENTAGWERLKLYYRVLAGVGKRDMTTTVLGQPISMPIVVAPTAFHKLACEAGEIAAAKAAKAAGTLFILSSLSNTAMEAGLCAGGESALVPALYLQGSGDHARSGATGGGCRRGGDRPDRRCARPGHARARCAEQLSIAGRSRGGKSGAAGKGRLSGSDRFGSWPPTSEQISKKISGSMISIGYAGRRDCQWW